MKNVLQFDIASVRVLTGNTAKDFPSNDAAFALVINNYNYLLVASERLPLGSALRSDVAHDQRGRTTRRLPALQSLHVDDSCAQNAQHYR